MQPIQKLQQQSATSRYHRQQLQIDNQLGEESRSSFSATLIQFNSAIGLWLCRLDNGSTIWAKSISSVGSKGKGDVVSLYKPSLGTPVIRYL